GDDVIHFFRITVGIHDGYDGNAEAAGFQHGDPFLAGIHHVHGVGQFLHAPDTAQVPLQPFPLPLETAHFLFRQVFHVTRLFHLQQFFQALHPGAHGAEVGEHAAQPAVVDVVHAAAGGLFGDGVLSLLLGPYEQYLAALEGQVAHEVVGGFQEPHGLLQVDDVDAVALGENVRSHLRVPATCLVP